MTGGSRSACSEGAPGAAVRITTRWSRSAMSGTSPSAVSATLTPVNPPARTPDQRKIQAWREVNELAERDLMIDGRWLGAPDTDR